RTPAKEEAVAKSAPRTLRRKPRPSETIVIEELFRITEQVRGLHFVRPVPVEVHNREAILEHLNGELDEDEKDLRHAHQLDDSLGLISADENIRGLLTRVLGEQVVGYYDPKADRLVARDDVMEALGEAESEDDESFSEAKAVLIHELVHALQTQHLHLADA